jgi:4-amino-4-deoxy-L-arabinose transferase-like glycosyltransferase
MSETRERRTNILILVALWLVFYCSFTLFTPPLLDDADSVHAEVAREMLVRHDFVTLYANGIRYLEKAPLYYWSMAACMKVFGATTAASRLPLAFAVLALTLLLEGLARRAFAATRAGLYAGLIALSSFGIFIFSRINIPDVLVCVFLVVSLYAYWRTEQQEQPSRNLCWIFDVAIALNILTKGLIGIVFPVAIVGLHLLLTRGVRGTLRRLMQFHPLSSTAILLAIAVPWHVLIALANPGHGSPGGLANINGHWQVPYPTDGNVHGWAWFYFVNEQLYRYLNMRVPHDYDTSPLLLFYGLIFIWLMPWSAFLPNAIGRALPVCKQLRNFALSQRERTNLFLIIWMIVPLAFFTFSTRQEYYVLPALPPMILLITQYLSLQAENLSGFEESCVLKAANAYLDDRLGEAILEYRQRNTTGGRLTISSDAAREVLPGYATPAERTANTFALGPPSSRLADAVWSRAMEVGPSQDRYIVEFLTGSPGSGKTASFINLDTESPLAIIREGMMDNFEISRARIQQTIDLGFVPTLQLVYENDPRTTLRRAVSRAMQFGRVVSIQHMSSLYVEIPKTVARLTEHFRNDLGLRVYSNSIDGHVPVQTSLDEALGATGAYTRATAREAMLDELEALRNDGRVSATVYRGFLGFPPAVDPPTSSRTLRRTVYESVDRASGKDAPWRTGARAVSAVLLALGTLAALACLFFIVNSRTPAPGTDLASLLQQNPTDYALSFGHFLDLTGPAMGLFRVPLALAAIALFLGPLAHWILRSRNQPHAATIALAGSAFLFLIAAHQGLVIFSPTLTSAQLAETIRPQLRPDDRIAIHGEYEAGSTLGFYLRRNDIHIVEGRSSNLWYGSFFPDAPRIFHSRDEIARMWRGPRRIFLWQDPHDPDRPQLDLPAPVFVIAGNGGKQILSNQPNH